LTKDGETLPVHSDFPQRDFGLVPPASARSNFQLARNPPGRDWISANCSLSDSALRRLTRLVA